MSSGGDAQPKNRGGRGRKTDFSSESGIPDADTNCGACGASCNPRIPPSLAARANSDRVFSLQDLIA
jgi:hypothetical protein